MNKKAGICLLFVLAVVLCGCSRSSKQEKEEYTVYYENASGTGLVESHFSPEAQSFDEMMEELLGRLQNNASGTAESSVFRRGVKVLGYERGIDALRVDFSEEYHDLNNIEEVLLRAAVVKTLCQIPGVTKIMITVDQMPLYDTDGTMVPAMDAESFINTKEGGINSYQYAKLMLYFGVSDGEKIRKEVRALHYSSNMVLERVVVEQLIAGPEEKNSLPLLSSNTKIQGIGVKNGICTVNLDAEANTAVSDVSMDPETILYCIVNSICDTCDGITGVRFEINGESSEKFRGKVDLNQVFTRNNSLVQKDSIEE